MRDLQLPIFFTGINISANNGSDCYRNGELLRFGKGVYLDNVFTIPEYSHLDLSEKVKLLNDTISKYAPWIASFYTPNATLISSSAYFGQANKNGQIFIDGVTSGRATIIGDDFFEINKNAIGKDHCLIQNVDISLKIERIRTKEAVSDSERFAVVVPDYLINNPEMQRYSNRSLPALQNLKGFKSLVSNNERMLVDVCRWTNDDPRSLNETDFINLCSFVGVSFIDGNQAQDRKVISKICSIKAVTPSVIIELNRRLEPLLSTDLGQSRRLDIEKALKLARIQFRVDHPENIFDIFHYDRKVAKLIDVGGHEWAIRGEGWLLPLDPTDNRMPPIISNLLPEIVKITPPEYVNFFKQSSRFMSNIQIIESGKNKTRNDYHTALLTEEQLFGGLIRDIPTFSADFDYQNTKTALHDNIPRCSGFQIKLPMHLGIEGAGQVLSIAADKSFTHMLKLASSNQQALVIGEWVGMHISKAIGANTARFQLIDLSNEYGDRMGYLTERFDIGKKGDRSEILACDLCAIMGLSSEDKYSGSMEIAVKAVSMNSADFDADRFGILAMTVATLLSDNTDLHLKNISLMRNEADPTSGYRLSPVYDMVVTSVLPTYAHSKLALSINGTHEPELSDIVTFAQESLNIDPEMTLQYMEMSCVQVKHLMETLVEMFPQKFKRVPEFEQSLTRCVNAVNKRIAIFQPSLQKEREQVLESNFTELLSIQELLDHEERKRMVETAPPYKTMGF